MGAMAPEPPPERRERRRPPARPAAPPSPLPPAAEEDDDRTPLPNRFRPVAYGALALTLAVVGVSLAFGVSAGDLPWLAIGGVLVLVAVMLIADRRRSRAG